MEPVTYRKYTNFNIITTSLVETYEKHEGCIEQLES